MRVESKPFRVVHVCLPIITSGLNGCQVSVRKNIVLFLIGLQDREDGEDLGRLVRPGYGQTIDFACVASYNRGCGRVVFALAG